MPRLIPTYRRHSTRNKAIVEHKGRRYTLPGKYNSAESRAAYATFIRQISAEREASEPAVPSSRLTIAMLVVRFLRWARGYYGANTEYECLRGACAVLLRFSDVLVDDFRAAKLKRARAMMETGQWSDPPRPWSRTYINHQISRIRRIFKWGVERELVSPDVLASLQAVAPLRKGRCAAKERPKVVPVPWSDVEVVLPFLGPVVREMVKLQWATGMRSENLCGLTPGEIDRTGDVWVYRPATHKTAWIGSELHVFLGPKAQEILAPFLDRPDDSPCFSPRESERLRSAERRSSRKTPQGGRKPRERKKLLDRYNSRSYRRAILYGFEKFDKERQKAAEESGAPFVPCNRWHPHQVRHARGTLVRRIYGLEGAQVALGHTSANVTQIYAERDLALARTIARELG